MKLFFSRWKLLTVGTLVLLLGVFAFAKKDPLLERSEAVSREFFGKNSPLEIGNSQRGLFSPDPNGEIPTIPIRGHAGYASAITHLKELKAMIEEESEKRMHLELAGARYQNLVAVAAQYVEIQKALYQNFAANVHELGTSPKSFDIDELNLQVEVNVGSQLFIMPELQKKYSVRHLPGDETLSKAELFISPYERMQLEISTLARVKTKAEYQKLIHLMFLRDSLVNRWSLSRVFKSPVVNERIVSPPPIYASFAEDQAGYPSQFRFSKDLNVEDLYQERIVSRVEGLTAQLKDVPLGSATEYRKLVAQFNESFEELKGVLRDDLEAVVANMFYVEESSLANRASQIIVESSFPQDDLRPSEIAKRIASVAFHSHKAALLTTLLRRVKIDLALVRGYLDSSEGSVHEEDIERVEKSMTLPAEELKRADQIVRIFLNSIEKSWKSRLVEKIKKYYETQLPKGKDEETDQRYAEFHKRVLEDSLDGVLGAKQVNNYQSALSKLQRIPSETARSLQSLGVPVWVQCVSASFGASSCTYHVKSEVYLSRLDASADLGMSWVIPWTPGQVADIFGKKLENIEKNDFSTWKVIKAASEDKVLMKEMAKFFEELNSKHQAAIAARQKQISEKILGASTALARKIKANPKLDLKATSEHRQIQTLQMRLQEVGQTPDEAVLTDSMFQAAAHKIFSEYIEKVSTPPALPTPTPEPTQPGYLNSKYRYPSRWETISPRDATAVRPPVLLIEPAPTYLTGSELRSKKVIELGKLFSLLGFGWEFFNKYKWHPKLVHGAQPVPFVVTEALFPKPGATAASKMGWVIKLTARKPKVSALSELSRTAAAQKFLAESVMANVYTRVPILRIQEGEDEDAPTGLERLESAYDATTGTWNPAKASQVFQSLLRTAVNNDRYKFEEAISANPLAPGESEVYKKIFRSQAYSRSLFATAAGPAKKRVANWDKDLKSETRTTSEKWQDAMLQVASVLFVASMVFLFWEFLPLIIPAVSGVITPASAFFSGFSVLGVSGSLIAGFLSGSNLLVQVFWVALVAVQGQIAFYTLPAQLQYQREIANSMVGMTSVSTRILAPAERASRENIQTLQEEIRSAKLWTGVGVALQVAFLPLQIKQMSRGFGYTGKAALSRLGQVNPELAQSMKAYSLSELIEKLGYAEGSKRYFERFTSALIQAKPVSAVNGGATLNQAQLLLAESLAARLSNSTEVGALFEARLGFLKEEILKLQKRAEKHFAVTQGAKTKDLTETVKQYFGAEISKIGFRLNHPQVKITIRSRVAQALEAGEFNAIEFGTQKHLLKAFLLRLKAEKMMAEAIHLRQAVERLKALELANGGVMGTHEIFAQYVGLQNLDHLDALFKWAVRHPEYQDTAFGQLLREARTASKDYKIVISDISRLSKKEQATYEAMNGKADVIVDDDLTMKLGEGQTTDPTVDEFFVMPGMRLGLDPQ
jgi:hypothetical protein